MKSWKHHWNSGNLRFWQQRRAILDASTRTVTMDESAINALNLKDGLAVNTEE